MCFDRGQPSALSRHFSRLEQRLDVLFNSAGLMYPPVELVTQDGYDVQFGTNVIGAWVVRCLQPVFPSASESSSAFRACAGHFYLTKLLLPLLLASAKSSPDGTARVINTSSMGHSFVSGIDFDTIRDGPKRIKAGTMKLYSQSKFVSAGIRADSACPFVD